MHTDLAVATADNLETQLAQAVQRVGKIGRALQNVFLVACGGSLARMIPLQFLCQTEVGSFEAHALNSREFTTRNPKSLGSNTLVILLSHSGDTPETVAAANFARERGATTIGFTHQLESPLAHAAEIVVGYQHGVDKTHAYTASPLMYRLVLALLDIVNKSNLCARAVPAVKKLDEIVNPLLESKAEDVGQWAEAHKRSSIIYTMGSGPNYGEAYSFAICLLQEMLWVHSQGINAAEYFHGPFEITDFDVPFLDLLGLGVSRPIDERAKAFAIAKSQDVKIIDAADWDLSLVPEVIRPTYAHLVFGPLLRQYADALGDRRGHPLSVRRYMWRMPY